MKCNYGCGKDGLFLLKNGKFCCSEFYQSCSKNKEKNSLSGKKAYINGRKSSSKKGVMSGWENKTKEEIQEIQNRSKKTLQTNFQNGTILHKPCIHSIETKKKLSEIRINFLESHSNHNCKWFSFIVNGNILQVQGTWERDVAQKLNDLGIIWERKRIKYLTHRTYTPDFYLPEYNMYIEVKGYMYEGDKYKMFKVLESNNIDLRLIETLSLLDILKKGSDVSLLPKFSDLYKESKINFSKFNNYWDS